MTCHHHHQCAYYWDLLPKPAIINTNMPIVTNATNMLCRFDHLFPPVQLVVAHISLGFDSSCVCNLPYFVMCVLQ